MQEKLPRAARRGKRAPRTAEQICVREPRTAGGAAGCKHVWGCQGCRGGYFGILPAITSQQPGRAGAADSERAVEKGSAPKVARPAPSPQGQVAKFPFCSPVSRGSRAVPASGRAGGGRSRPWRWNAPGRRRGMPGARIPSNPCAEIDPGWCVLLITLQTPRVLRGREGWGWERSPGVGTGTAPPR